MEGNSGWVAVRCIFRSDHESVQYYEERVTLWRTGDLDVAIELAEAEARAYCEDLTTEFVGMSQAYLLSDEPEHGAEVFSMMRPSTLDPDDYLDRYFET